MGNGPINQGVCPITIIAAGPIVSHRFVDVTSEQAGAAATALGVSAYDALAGDATTIDTLGVVSVEAGAVVAVGDLIETDASARAITRTAGPIVARSLDAAAAAGDLIRCVIIPN